MKGPPNTSVLEVYKALGDDALKDTSLYIIYPRVLLDQIIREAD